jgi:hypothetical protein
MKKVLQDGTLGISQNDVFPEELKGNYCGGSQETGALQEKDELENYYFE